MCGRWDIRAMSSWSTGMGSTGRLPPRLGWRRAITICWRLAPARGAHYGPWARWGSSPWWSATSARDLYLIDGARRPGRGLRRRVRGDQREREPVIPFAAHRLQHRRRHAGLGGQRGVEAPHALDVGVRAGRVDHPTVAHDVVGDN